MTQTYTQLHDVGCPKAKPILIVGCEGCTCPILTQEMMELRDEFDPNCRTT